MLRYAVERDGASADKAGMNNSMLNLVTLLIAGLALGMSHSSSPVATGATHAEILTPDDWLAPRRARSAGFPGPSRAVPGS